jgi:hypothetical protein
VDTENLLMGGWFTMTREGVENVSIEDVDGDGPFAGVRPKAGGGGTADDGEVLSVIGERDVLRIEDSVWEGDMVVRGTGLIGGGGEGRKVGGDNMGGLKPNGYGVLSRLGRDGSDAVGGQWMGYPWPGTMGGRIPPDSVEREPRGAVFGPPK